jgi:hypothetical protein
MTKRASSLCRSLVGMLPPPPDWADARWNRPDGDDMPIRVVTFNPPPDWAVDHYPIGIAAEVLDIVADPLQRRDKVRHAHIHGVFIPRPSNSETSKKPRMFRR